MNRLRFAFHAAALCACTVVLAAKVPITHEQMWKMKRLGPPVVSPDGRWAVFSVTSPAYDSKETSSDLWLMPASGSAEPRQITFTRGAESGPEWSPDSSRLVFSAKREGDAVNIEIERQTQVFVDTVREAVDERLGALAPLLEQWLRTQGRTLDEVGHVGLPPALK